MKLRLLMLGKTRRPELRAVLDDYVKRISRHSPIEINEVRDEAVLRDPHAQPKTTLPSATQDRIASIASELVNRLQLA